MQYNNAILYSILYINIIYNIFTYKNISKNVEFYRKNKKYFYKQ